jgi:hypothetical protein
LEATTPPRREPRGSAAAAQAPKRRAVSSIPGRCASIEDFHWEALMITREDLLARPAEEAL